MMESEVKKTINRTQKIILILNHLKEKDFSIEELSKVTNLKRSPLIYYLDILEKEGWIKRERILSKVKGRPTIIKFNHKKNQDHIEEWKKQINEKDKKFLKNPITKEVLTFINNNKGITKEEILIHLDKTKLSNNVYDYIEVINYLTISNYIKNTYDITSKGKEVYKKLN